MSNEVKLTSVVAGESVIELAKLREIKALAEREIEEHEKIINNHSNVEFKTQTTFELKQEQLNEMEEDSYYGNKIQEIVVRRTGEQAVLFIKRGKYDD